MTPYRTCVYNKNGETKIAETIEERDALYQSGDWYESMQVAKDNVKQRLDETKEALDKNEAEQTRLTNKAKKNG